MNVYPINRRERDYSLAIGLALCYVSIVGALALIQVLGLIWTADAYAVVLLVRHLQVDCSGEDASCLGFAFVRALTL